METVLIIGTSNSIVRGGWCDGFHSSYKGKVIKFLLGGTPFWQFLGELEEKLTSDITHVIIDTSPNDESHFSQIGHIWFFEKLYRDFLQCISSRAHTLVMRIPPQQWIQKENSISVIQKNCCEDNNIEYYDISNDLILAADGSEVYLDKLHPHAALMYSIGQLIGEKLKPVVELDKIRKPFKNKYHEHLAENKNLQEEVISTSLISKKFLVIPEGKSLNTGKSLICFGFFVNLQNCNATLRLTGPGGSRHIECYFEKRERPTISFVTIKEGCMVNEISVVRPVYFREYALHSKIEAGPYVASIGNLLFYQD